ncbi:transmembrane protein 177-like [Ornithodoros turicata]|uniref:transmembrane protein 177-like n=1 Tax=Ornithodoros turicata TaxID=34597 RepID=UPI00313877B0
MTSSRLGAFFLTPQGQQVSGGVACFASIAGFAAYYVPNTFCLDKYRQIVQHYRYGMPMELSEEVQTRANEVLTESTVKQSRKALIRFFTVAKLDTFIAGSTSSRYGALIGIPPNFSYTAPNQVETQLMAVANTEEPKWSAKEGQQLKEALVLSDRAQKFAIARELYWANTYYVEVRAFALSINILNAYILGRLLNTRLNLYHRVPRRIRIMLYGVLAAFGGTMFLFIKDASTQYWERDADDSAARMGSDYLLGGIEYYEKMLRRNRCLRELMGGAGASAYTSKGNEESFVRMAHLPLTHRLDRLRKMLEEQQVALPVGEGR